MFVLYI
jgi:hypothetical protein